MKHHPLGNNGANITETVQDCYKVVTVIIIVGHRLFPVQKANDHFSFPQLTQVYGVYICHSHLQEVNIGHIHITCPEG